MKTIFNFGYLLDARVTEQITQALGPHTIANVQLQLVPNRPDSESVVEACRRAVGIFGWPDYVIPPRLPIPAIFADRFFSQASDDFPPVISYVPIIRLVQIKAAPPVYIYGGIE